MKKTLLIVGLIVLALGVLGVGVALAQGELPPVTGMMNMMRQGGYRWMHEYMHDYVEQELAAKLALTEKQVEEQLAAGKPMYQIALDNGIKQDNLANFMNEVHQGALAKAVRDGVITQEQADWMLPMMQNMFQNGYGAGNCPMHNGQDGSIGRGSGSGMMRGTRNP